MPPMHTHRYVERLVDLLDPSLNRLHGLDLDEARRRVLSGDPAAVRAIDGSFAIVAKDGITIRMARSLDRPMRYFLAKRQEGPALFVADRIDTLHRALDAEGLAGQFHPSYTRMVPAHHVVEIQLVGCPDPDPIYTRFFTPERGALPADLDEIGRRYVGAASLEDRTSGCGTSSARRRGAPIGVCFSGGIDSGSVFLLVYHAMIGLGLSPSRLKAFVLDAGGGPTSRRRAPSCRRVGLELFLEAIAGDPAGLDAAETLRVIEDYKPLDVECAAMGLQLLPRDPRALSRLAAPRRRRRRRREPQGLSDRGEPRADDPQRRRQPDAVSGGLGRRPHQALADLQRRPVAQLRPHLRAGAPLRLRRLQPATRSPAVLEVAEGIPFAALTGYDVPTLYALKGEIVAARRPGGHRLRRCRRSRSAASSTAPSTPRRCARSSVRGQARRPTGAASSASTACRSRDSVSAPAVYPIGRAARDRFVLDAARPAPRSSIRGRRPGSSSITNPTGTAASSTSPRCSSPARVSVALRDVRPVARHDRDRHAAGAIPHQIGGAAACGARRSAAGDTSSCTTRAASSIPGRCRRPTTRRSPRAVADVGARDVESHPRAGRRSHLALPRRSALSRLARRARSGDGARDRASGRARAPEQGLHASTTSRARRRALAAHGVGLRVFLLVHPPFVPRDEQDAWLRRSIDVAIDGGASVISLIPTRGDNGAMAALAAAGAVRRRHRSQISKPPRRWP